MARFLRLLLGAAGLAACVSACSGSEEPSPAVSGGAAGASGSSGAAGSAGEAELGGAAGASGSGAGGSAGAEADAGSDGATTDVALDASVDVGEGGSVEEGGSDAPGDVAPDPCEGKADGAYCGGALGVSSSKLVTCEADQTLSTKSCANGCLQTSIGSDVCKSACCLAKPPGSFVRGYNACSSYSGGGEHYGIDYSSALGTKIPAGMDGTVVKVVTGYGNCWGSGSGSIACSTSCMAHYNMIRLKAACGDPDNSKRDFYVEYAHVSKIATGIKVGSVVKKGQTIAYVGESGCASGPHIHFETMSVAKGAAPTVHTCGSVDPKTRYCP